MQVFGHHDSAQVPSAAGPFHGRRPEAPPAADRPGQPRPAPEIEALLGPLAVIPDVRAQRVAEAAARLSEGFYATREAAQRAAAVVLDS